MPQREGTASSRAVSLYKQSSARLKAVPSRSIKCLLLNFSQHLCPKQSLVYPMEALGHPRPQQLVVEDLKQVVHDEPHRLLRGHPLQMIEAGKIYRTGECSQSPLTPQIEIKIEVTDSQLAQVP